MPEFRTSRMHEADEVLYLICAVILLVALVCWPSVSKMQYQATYAVAFVQLGITLTLCVKRYHVVRTVWDPFIIVSFIYTMLYAVAPMNDIATENYSWFGYDLFGHAAEATLYAVLGYLSFAAAMYITEGSMRSEGVHYIEIDVKAAASVAVIIWCFCFLANAYYLIVADGNSLLYCLTFGLLGSGGKVSSEASLGFIAMFSYSLPAATLAYIAYGKNRLAKIAMSYAMLALQITRGFRFLIVQIFIMYATFFRLKSGKKVSTNSLLFVVIGAMAVVFAMTLTRDSIRAGSGVDYAALLLATPGEILDDTLWFNLRIYHNYHGMVAVIPQQFGYVGLRQIIVGVLIMFVPRLLWPGKPTVLGAGEDLATLLGPAFYGTGQAYPNLGEFYYAFGLTAIMLFMALYGVFLQFVTSCYWKTRDELSLICYATVLANNVQLIIRGYMPSNFWMIVFSVLPIIIIAITCRAKKVSRPRTATTGQLRHHAYRGLVHQDAD